jgi:hypothetical protein
MITHWTKEMIEGHRYTFYDMFMRQLSADMEADRKKKYVPQHVNVIPSGQLLENVGA